MILVFFIGIGIAVILPGSLYDSGALVWLGFGIICYGCASTLLWFLARFVIPGSRIDLAKLVVQSLGFSKDAIVLDVGTGLGLYAVEAARLLTGGKAFAIDVWEPERIPELQYFHKLSRPSGHSVANASANARIERVNERIVFLNMDANRIDFPPNFFDAITCAYVLGHLGVHAKNVLMEMHRVLKPGGKVAIVDNIRDFIYFLLSTPHLFLQSYLRGAKGRRLTHGYWESLVQQAGLKITKSRKSLGIIWMELVRC